MRTVGVRLVGAGRFVNFLNCKKNDRRVFPIVTAKSGADFNVEGVAVAVVIVLTLRFPDRCRVHLVSSCLTDDGYTDALFQQNF